DNRRFRNGSYRLRVPHRAESTGHHAVSVDRPAGPVLLCTGPARSDGRLGHMRCAASRHSTRGLPGKHGMINLPTWITIIRIFLTPVLVVVLMTRVTAFEPIGLSWQMIGVTVFLLASFTDYLDGWLARRRNQVTTLGILLDPIADKLLTSAAFISLVQIGVARAWM